MYKAKIIIKINQLHNQVMLYTSGLNVLARGCMCIN